MLCSCTAYKTNGDKISPKHSRPDLCEGTQSLQPPGHSSRKAPLAAQGREQQAVLRPVHLVCPVGAAKLLQALVSAPRQLQGEVHPPALIHCPPADRHWLRLVPAGAGLSD